MKQGWTKERREKFPESWSKVKIMLQSTCWGTKPAWNKGKTKLEFPQLSNSGVKKGNIPFNKGKKLSESHRKNLMGKRESFSLESRKNMSGRVPWNKKYFGEKIYNPWIILYRSPEYKRFRFEMFKRDNFQCVQCESKKTIELDHIKPKSLFPNIAMAEWNVRTLCHECHKKTETYGMNENRRKHLTKLLAIDSNPLKILGTGGYQLNEK